MKTTPNWEDISEILLKIQLSTDFDEKLFESGPLVPVGIHMFHWSTFPLAGEV